MHHEDIQEVSNSVLKWIKRQPTKNNAVHDYRGKSAMRNTNSRMRIKHFQIVHVLILHGFLSPWLGHLHNCGSTHLTPVWNIKLAGSGRLTIEIESSTTTYGGSNKKSGHSGMVTTLHLPSSFTCSKKWFHAFVLNEFLYFNFFNATVCRQECHWCLEETSSSFKDRHSHKSRAHQFWGHSTCVVWRELLRHTWTSSVYHDEPTNCHAPVFASETGMPKTYFKASKAWASEFTKLDNDEWARVVSPATTLINFCFKMHACNF